MNKRLLSGVAAIATVAAVAGCGSSGSTKSGTSPKNGTAPHASKTKPDSRGQAKAKPSKLTDQETKAVHSKYAQTIPTKVPNSPADRQFVTLTGCTSAPGGGQAKGTVSNGLGKDATYKITVFFADKQDTDIGWSAATVTVKNGAHSDWVVNAKFVPVPHPLCILAGVKASTS